MKILENQEDAAMMNTKSRTALSALIARLEKATGPNRELDCLIAIAADARPFVFRSDNQPMHYDAGARVVRVGPGHGPCFDPLQYTASIDAAMALVPAGMEWHLSNKGQIGAEGLAFAGIYGDPMVGSECDTNAATPAIALCIAALEARVGQSSTEGKASAMKELPGSHQ